MSDVSELPRLKPFAFIAAARDWRITEAEMPAGVNYYPAQDCMPYANPCGVAGYVVENPNPARFDLSGYKKEKGNGAMLAGDDRACLVALLRLHPMPNPKPPYEYEGGIQAVAEWWYDVIVERPTDATQFVFGVLVGRPEGFFIYIMGHKDGGHRQKAEAAVREYSKRYCDGVRLPMAWQTLRA